MKHYNQLSKEELKKFVLKDPSQYQRLNHEYQRGSFIQIPHNLFENERFLNEFFFTKQSRIYYFLRRHIVRGKMFLDRMDIYGNYWEKGWLATAPRFNKLQIKLKMPESTIRNQISRMEEAGIILVDRYDAAEAMDVKGRQVYILGTCIDGFEKYFIDDVFLRDIKPEMLGDGVAPKTECPLWLNDLLKKWREEGIK